jgi:gluconokinase
MSEAPAAPPILLVMGVSGSGKTTVGSLLAARLGWDYAEADAFHSAANIAKMAAGQPLTDEDRRPWLAAIGDWIDATTAAGRPGVVTCSALKRSYRDDLRANRPQVRLVYLDADAETVQSRLTARNGHFFPPELLASQFADLEPPAADEHALRVPIGPDPRAIVDEVVAAEHLERVASRHEQDVRAGNAGPPPHIAEH